MNDDWRVDAEAIVLQIKDHFQKYGKRILTNKDYLNIYKNSRSYLNFLMRLSSGLDDIEVEHNQPEIINNNNQLDVLRQQIENEKAENRKLQNEVDSLKGQLEGFKNSNISEQEHTDLKRDYDDCKRALQKLQTEFDSMKNSNTSEEKYNGLRKLYDDCKSTEQNLQSKLAFLNESTVSKESHDELNKKYSDNEDKLQKLEIKITEYEMNITKYEADLKTFRNIESKLMADIKLLKDSNLLMMSEGTKLNTESQQHVNIIMAMIESLSVIFNKQFVPGTPIDVYLQEIRLMISEQLQNQSSLSTNLDKKIALLKEISSIKLTGTYPTVKIEQAELDVNSSNYVNQLKNIFENQVSNILAPYKQNETNIKHVFSSGHEIAMDAVSNLKPVLGYVTVDKLQKYLIQDPNSNLMSLLDTLLFKAETANKQVVVANQMIIALDEIAERYEFLIKYINSKRPETFTINGNTIMYKARFKMISVQIQNAVEFFRSLTDALEDIDRIIIGKAYEVSKAYLDLITIITPSANIENLNFNYENFIISGMLQIYKVAKDNQIENLFHKSSVFLNVINKYRQWRKMLLNFGLLYTDRSMLLAVQDQPFSDELITFIYENAVQAFPQLIMNRYLSNALNHNIQITQFLAQFLQHRQNIINKSNIKSTVSITEIPSIEDSFLAIEGSPYNERVAVYNTEMANNNMEVSDPSNIPIALTMSPPLPEFDSKTLPIVLFEPN